MAKKHFGTKLLTTVLATFALASCQSESTLLEPVADNLCDVELTVIASKGELTRTNLNLSEDQKKLLLTWNVGDLIHVSESDGRYTGSLKVTELLEEGKKAKFQGTIRTILTNGKRTFKFSYLGKDDPYTGSRNTMAEPKVYDFTNQVNAGVKALAKNDLLVTDGEVDLKDGEATFENLYMRRQFAFGRFTLLYNGEPLEFSDNTVVTINTSTNDIKTGATFDFKSDDVTPAGNSSISLTTSENDFYVTFVPGSQKSAFKFNVVVNGEEYEGFSSEYLIEKNDFYRRGSDVEIGEAMPINVTHVDGRDDQSYKLTYYANINGSTESYPETKAYKAAKEYFDVKDYMLSPVHGYTFAGWNTQADGNGDNFAVGGKVEMVYPDMEKALYAQWTIDYKATLKYDDKEEDVRPNDGETSVILPPLPDNGEEEFIGWKKEGGDDNDATKGPWVFTEEEPQVVLVPVYKTKSYQWQFKFVDDPEVGTASYGAILESGATPHTMESAFPTDNPNSTFYHKNVKDGYTFLGWEYNGNMVGKNGNTYLASDIVASKENAEKIELGGKETYRVCIYAKWSKNDINYVVNYEDGKNNVIGSKPAPSKEDKVTVNVNEGAPSVTAPAGYEFKGWAIKGSTEVKTSVELTKAIPTVTVVPVFAKKPTVSTPGYDHGSFN